MSKEKNIETTEKSESRVYELGFHFLPTLSEDEAVVQFSHLKSLVEKQGGSFISEEAPVMVDLAYEVSKTIKSQKKHYNTSYFGWVKFEMSPENIPDFEKSVKLFDPILRYILITTVRENTLSGIKDAKDSSRSKSKDAEVAPEVAPEVAEVVEAPINEEQIDKSIDELVK